MSSDGRRQTDAKRRGDEVGGEASREGRGEGRGA